MSGLLASGNLVSNLAGKTIAITRPVDQAKKLSALIVEAGGTPILFPLITITALENYANFDATIAQLNGFQMAIFISSNAVQHGMPRVLKAFSCIPNNLTFAAIGPITSQELHGFGAKQVLTPTGKFDSESLLALPEMQAVKNKNIMIFRGVGGRDVLAEILKARGAHITFAECYQRKNPQTNSDVLAQLYVEKNLHGIVVTSSEAMRNLLDLAGDASWLKQTPIFVNHARIAETEGLENLNVHVANAAGDAAMLQNLQQHLA